MFRVIVTNDLSVEIRNDHMSSTALSQSFVSTVTADSIISVNNSFTIFIKSCNKVESIIGEESSTVESFGD